MQRTIKKTVSVEGIGLHTGKPTKVTFLPAEPARGVVFTRIDVNPAQSVSMKDFHFGQHKRRTAISKNGIEIHTIEHLMAALWALSIDNIIVEIDNIELPGLDGSAKDFLQRLESAGIKEQEGEPNTLKIKEPVWAEKGNAFIGAFPGRGFKVSYLLEMPLASIGRQCLSVELDGQLFSKEIAPARTFCMKEEAEMLLKQGFGKGANTANTLVMDEKGPIDNTLRFSDEHVRHKILDLVGDLYLTGSLIEGRIIGIRSGHELNLELVKKIMESERSDGRRTMDDGRGGMRA